MLLQRHTVFLIQNAAAGIDTWQHMVIGPQQKQALYPVAVVAGDLTDLHLIQRGGNRAHTVLRQHQSQELGKLLAGQLRIAQNLHELIQHIAEDRPELLILLRKLHLPVGKQRLRLLLQRPGYAGFFGKCVKRFRFLLRRRQGFHPVMQRQKRGPDLNADAVDLLQSCPLFLGPVLSVAVGMGRPVPVTQPHITADIPADHIVFQQVAGIPRDAGHAGFQIPEHILVLKAAGHGIHGTEQAC